MNTYCRIRVAGKWHVAMVTGCAIAARQVVFTLAEGETITLKYPESFTEVNLDTPEIGYFNYKHYALVTYRVPARQWRRGLCHDNHEIYNPFRRLFPAGDVGIYRPSWGMALAKGMFQCERTLNPQHSLEALRKGGCISSAITSDLALSYSPTDNFDPLIWYKTNPVGHVSRDRFNILDELYEQEVNDILKRIGCEAWIS